MAISCEPSDLQNASRCWCLTEAQLDRIEIYLLCAWANGGEPPQFGFVFGNPDEDWSFGDPGTGDEFGAPF